MANEPFSHLYRQLQTGAATAGGEHYNGMFDCFRKIIKQEG
jgi:solute carrier family 25 2-oxodicarboxylate transporter 21